MMLCILHIPSILWLSCAIVLPVFSAYGNTDSTAKLSMEFPHFDNNKKLVQEIFLSTPVAITGTVQFSCFKFNSPTDSIFVYGQKSRPIKVQAGLSTIRYRFGQNDANSFLQAQFYDILHKCGVVPAGNYRIYLSIAPDSVDTIRRDFLLLADSNLSNTGLGSDVSNALVPKQKEGLFGKVQTAAVSRLMPASKTLELGKGKISRLFRSRGLTTQTEQKGDKSIVNLWYEQWFVGRYELSANQSAVTQIRQSQARAAGNISSSASNELESYRSLFTQVRELNKTNKEDNELSGEISLSGNSSSGQPEYSAQDNNFYEVRGRAETEVAEIPVSIEGYYTSQDAHRQIKSSYIRVHYDTDRAKQKLMKLIDGYRTQFTQTVSKGKGLEQVYGSYLNNLQGSKDRMLHDITGEAGLPSSSAFSAGSLNTEGLQARIEAALAQKMKDTAALLRAADGKVDSAGELKRSEAKAKLIKDSASRLYAAAMKKYEQVKRTEAQIEKYSALLKQYQNTAYFDSAMAYSKVKDLKSGDETTYKQMAKSAAGLLPEGKAKTFIAGLTSLDAGIFPKYVSKYTMAGQQLKGISAGYDLGFAQAGLALGSTEYAGRDGSLDKYTTYTGSLLFSPAKGQKAGLVYYGYTPSKSMLRGDDFFKNSDIALPSFREPVHVVSATYEGSIAKAVTIDAEAATSFRSASDQKLSNGFDADRLAWHLNAEGHIPVKTPLTLTGSYEHGGSQFQNSTLPLTIAGTDLYKGGIKGDFFHAFLTAGVEFNHMQQSNFYSTGGNNRWGFELATHSKQYPSVTLSYKPFATFRAYNDTLAVAQRPLQGAVWAGKASWQFKRPGGVSYRFSAVVNRSTSHSDSVSYGADLLQLNAIYTDKRWMVMLSGGQSMLNTNSGYPADTLNPAHVRTTFGMGSVGYNFSKGISLTGGADVGFASYGLSKWGLNGGLNYQMPRLPFTVRVYGRYAAYRLPGYSGTVTAYDTYGTDRAEPMSWRGLVSGGLEVIWRFRMKVGNRG